MGRLQHQHLLVRWGDEWPSRTCRAGGWLVGQPAPLVIFIIGETRVRGPGGQVVWGAGLSSCNLQVAGSIPVAAQSPTTGASVNTWYNLYEAVNG